MRFSCELESGRGWQMRYRATPDDWLLSHSVTDETKRHRAGPRAKVDTAQETEGNLNADSVWGLFGAPLQAAYNGVNATYS